MPSKSKKKKKAKQQKKKPKIVLRFSTDASADASKTKVEAVSKVSDDAETFLNFIAEKRKLKMQQTLHQISPMKTLESCCSIL